MADSVHESILDDFGGRLSALLLLDETGRPLGIERRTSLADVGLGQNLSFPCICYGPDGTLSSQDADTAVEVWNYPVAVRILARLPLTEPGFTPLLLKWRQKIRDAFHRKPVAVSGAEEAYQALLGPSPVSEPEAASYQLLSSRLSFAVAAIEERP